METESKLEGVGKSYCLMVIEFLLGVMKKLWKYIVMIAA